MEEPKFEEKVSPRKSDKKLIVIILGIVVLIGLIIVIAVGFLIWAVLFSSLNGQQHNLAIPSITPTPQKKEFVILKTVGGKEITKTALYDFQVLKWNDEIIFVQDPRISGYPDVTRYPSVYSYNLKTNKKTKLVDLKNDILPITKAGENEANEYGLTIRVQDNKLYVDVGAYRMQGFIFSMPLLQGPLTVVARADGEGEGISLVNMNGKEILVSGFADGCGSIGSYKLFNPQNNMATKIVDVSSECEMPSQHVLGVDDSGRMLVSETNIDSTTKMQYLGKIVGIPVSNPVMKETIVEFPSDNERFSDAFYWESNNALVFENEKMIQIYSLDSDSVTNTIPVTNTHGYLAGNMLCGQNGSVYPGINLETGKTMGDSDICKKQYKDQEGNISAEEQIKNLGLQKQIKVSEE